MSLAAEQIGLFAFIKNNWNETTRCPVVYQNKKNPAVKPGVLYMSVVIVPNPEARVRNSICTPKLVSNYGHVVFTFYAPEDDGSLDQKELIDVLIELMDERVLTLSNNQKMKFGICKPLTLGVRDGTYRIVVSVPYRRDEG